MFIFRKLKIKKSLILHTVSKINIKFFITLACLLFLGNSIYSNFDALSNQLISIREILWLSAGIIFTLLSIILNAFAWKFLIKSIGCDIKELSIVRIYITTNIYKYLPGGIWHFASRYKLLSKKLPTEKSVESVLLEPLLMIVSGLFFIPFGSLNIYTFIFCWPSGLIFLSGFRKLIIKKLKLMKASIFTNNENDRNLFGKKEKILKKVTYPFNALFVETLFILFRFFGFLCCINAFSFGLLTSKSELISSFCLSWIIGLVVPAAPGGVGVFESMILFTLGSQIPEASLIASLLCYRLVSTLSDILAAFFYPVKEIFLNSILD